MSCRHFFFMLQSLLYHLNNRCFQAIFFLFCFSSVFNVYYILIQTLSQWASSTSTAAYWFISLFCLIPMLLKPGTVPFHFLRRNSASKMQQWQFQLQKKLWIERQSAFRSESLYRKNLSSWEVRARHSAIPKLSFFNKFSEAFLGIPIHAMLDGRIWEILFHFNRETNFHVNLIQGRWYLQLVL